MVLEMQWQSDCESTHIHTGFPHEHSLHSQRDSLDDQDTGVHPGAMEPAAISMFDSQRGSVGSSRL